MNKGKDKSFADITATPAPMDFTKVTHKKKALQPFIHPEYTRLNRQLIVETEGGIPEFISNDSILEVVKSRREPQGLKFIAGEHGKNKNLRFETNLNVSAGKESELMPEIPGALLFLNIKATNIYPNNRWSRYVIHGIPVSISNNNWV